MKRFGSCFAVCCWLFAGIASANVIGVHEGAGSLATLVVVRDGFRDAIGGGTVAELNGSFGGLRREINWDGVPNTFADPNPLPGDFFNVNSPRGIVLSTPGSGFMVSANAGSSAPIEFGFGTQLKDFSAQRLFTAVGSNISDVKFFLPGTNIAATTSAFGVIFSDVDVAGSTRLEFYDDVDQLIFARDVVPSGADEQFSFLGIEVDAASLISRVRIYSGSVGILSNGVLAGIGDLVVMDDFIYAEPMLAVAPIPEPPVLALLALVLAGLGFSRRTLTLT